MRDDVELPRCWEAWSPPAFATQYAFNAEHRYLYPVFGLLLALVAECCLGVPAWPKTRVALPLTVRWSANPLAWLSARMWYGSG
ncbi:MAG: hypothetical protein IPG06_20915 [Haliea sp.]|nr:hypothetical protein [Haliea sp.]